LYKYVKLSEGKYIGGFGFDIKAWGLKQLQWMPFSFGTVNYFCVIWG
jgi:hypothetical protein